MQEWQRAFPEKIRAVETFLRIMVTSFELGEQYIWAFRPDDPFGEVMRARYGQMGLDHGESLDFVRALEELRLDLDRLASIKDPKLRDYVSALPDDEPDGRTTAGPVPLRA